MDGPAPEIVSQYLNSGMGGASSQRWEDTKNAPGDDVVKLRAVRVISSDGQIISHVDIRHPVGIEMEYEVFQPGCNIIPDFRFQNAEGIQLFTSLDNDPEWIEKARPTGRSRSICWIPGNFLAEGLVYVSVGVLRTDALIRHFYERDIVAFNVIDKLEPGAVRVNYAGKLTGVVSPWLEWKTEFLR
jgi:lipopolysaccharide transport system ATP-binding protein